MSKESGHLTTLLPNLSEADRVKLHSRITDNTVGFFGTTAIARPSITAVGTTTATTTLNETKIDRLYTALRNLGLIDTGG